jgi:hypothetical protein
MVGPLQRPGRAYHRARCGHAARQPSDRGGGDARDSGGPVGILHDTVDLSGEIRQDPLEAGAVARQEALVVQPLPHQGVNQRQHHGGVGIGLDRNPGRSDRLRAVVAHRADIDDFNTGRRQCAQRIRGGVSGASALCHLGVLRIRAAEHHQEPAMARNR